MSRVGKQPIQVPSGVTVSVADRLVTVKGPKGTLTHSHVDTVDVGVVGSALVVTRKGESREARACHGLTRALLRNLVLGVSKGFEKRLELVGIGFRAEVKGRKVVMNLGYSHPIEHELPAGVDVVVDKAGKIIVQGADKQLVGQVAADIRAYRTPDHYKGKGLRYEGEYVRIKTGKSA